MYDVIDDDICGFCGRKVIYVAKDNWFSGLQCGCEKFDEYRTLKNRVKDLEIIASRRHELRHSMEERETLNNRIKTLETLVITEDYSDLKQRIKEHEGCLLIPYKDTLGYETIGYGHKRQKTDPEAWYIDGITQEQAEQIFEADFHIALFNADRIISPLDHPKEVFEVLVEMVFQMGYYGVMSFKKMIAALRRHDYKTAAKEMLDSKWATQTPGRAKTLASIVEHNNVG